MAAISVVGRSFRNANHLLFVGRPISLGVPESVGSHLFPDRDLLGAVARKRLAFPAAPALPKRHPGEPCHEVELRRPDVTEWDRALLERSADGPEVV